MILLALIVLKQVQRIGMHFFHSIEFSLILIKSLEFFFFVDLNKNRYLIQCELSLECVEIMQIDFLENHKRVIVLLPVQNGRAICSCKNGSMSAKTWYKFLI